MNPDAPCSTDSVHPHHPAGTPFTARTLDAARTFDPARTSDTSVPTDTDLHPFSIDAARPAAGAGETPPPADLPARILVAPYGEIASAHGAFLVDADALSATIAAFEDHAADLPVDFEHQTLGGAYSSPTGLAPAAGWIKALHAVLPSDAEALPPPGAADASAGSAAPPSFPEPGLWADVEWTPLAAEHLRTRQYRYLSPVALIRRSDRRMIGLHSVALTNKPAISGIRPVIASGDLPASRRVAPLTDGYGIDAPPAALARLRAALALPSDAEALPPPDKARFPAVV